MNLMAKTQNLAIYSDLSGCFWGHGGKDELIPEKNMKTVSLKILFFIV
jgi:hypothetical protein